MKRYHYFLSKPRPQSCITLHSIRKRFLHPTSRTTSSAHDSDLFPSDPDPFIPSADGFRTLRRRRGDPSKPSLPVPPLLDQRVDSSRRRHESPRPRQDWSALTPFQEELVSNPFAQILLSPLRTCSLTRTLYPRHLLLPFGPSLHPATPTSMPLRPRNPPVPGSITPHIIPLPFSPSVPPRSYALLGRKVLGMLKERKVRSMLIPAGVEGKYGIQREKWCFDIPFISSATTDLLVGDVTRQLSRLDREGKMDVIEDRNEGEEGEVRVVLRPGGGEGEGSGKKGWMFVLPPSERGEELRGGLRQKRGLRTMPGAVKFRFEQRTMPAVLALLRMDMFYRSDQRNVREEITDLWAKHIEANKEEMVNITE